MSSRPGQPEIDRSAWGPEARYIYAERLGIGDELGIPPEISEATAVREAALVDVPHSDQAGRELVGKALELFGGQVLGVSPRGKDAEGKPLPLSDNSHSQGKGGGTLLDPSAAPSTSSAAAARTAGEPRQAQGRYEPRAEPEPEPEAPTPIKPRPAMGPVTLKVNSRPGGPRG